jgi:hypothetical protein
MCGVTLWANIHAWNVGSRPNLEIVSEHQPQPVKYPPWIGATHPTALPAPALVGVTDINALASRACNAARNSLAENLFTGLAVTGRSNTFVSAHVPGELARHLADVVKGHDGGHSHTVSRRPCMRLFSSLSCRRGPEYGHELG